MDITAKIYSFLVSQLEELMKGFPPAAGCNCANCKPKKAEPAKPPLDHAAAYCTGYLHGKAGFDRNPPMGEELSILNRYADGYTTGETVRKDPVGQRRLWTTEGQHDIDRGLAPRFKDEYKAKLDHVGWYFEGYEQKQMEPDVPVNDELTKAHAKIKLLEQQLLEEIEIAKRLREDCIRAEKISDDLQDPTKAKLAELRDLIAESAMKEFLADYLNDKTISTFEKSVRGIAAYSYRIADAMMEARG